MLTTKKAAEYLGISYTYLRNMRKGQHNHDGPRHMVLPHPRGKACYYSIAELDLWKKEHIWKQKKALIVVFLFLISACGPSYVDPQLQGSLDEFTSIYHISTSNLSIELVDKFNDSVSDEVGRCDKGLTGTIYILRSYWNHSSDLTKKALMFHELGHCVFYRSHTSELRSDDNCPKSLMYPDVLYDGCFSAHYVDYLRELPGQ